MVQVGADVGVSTGYMAEQCRGLDHDTTEDKLLSCDNAEWGLYLQVAAKVGVNEGYVAQRCRGAGSTDTAATDRHCRFAAACALNAMLSEQASTALEEVWGKPDTLTKQGECSCCARHSIWVVSYVAMQQMHSNAA